MCADHDFPTPAGHCGDDDAIEPGAMLANDVFHPGIDVARLLTRLDAERHQPEFGLVRDIGRAPLHHHRPTDRFECGDSLRARPTQPMRHDRDSMFREQRQAIGLVQHRCRACHLRQS